MASEITRARIKLAILKKQHQAMIGRAVRKLRDRGYDHATIADILGLRESTVRSAEKEREEYEEHLKKIGG